jgi:hypothetical protein
MIGTYRHSSGASAWPELEEAEGAAEVQAGPRRRPPAARGPVGVGEHERGPAGRDHGRDHLDAESGAVICGRATGHNCPPPR